MGVYLKHGRTSHTWAYISLSISVLELERSPPFHHPGQVIPHLPSRDAPSPRGQLLATSGPWPGPRRGTRPEFFPSTLLLLGGLPLHPSPPHLLCRSALFQKASLLCEPLTSFLSADWKTQFSLSSTLSLPFPLLTWFPYREGPALPTRRPRRPQGHGLAGLTGLR